MCNNYDKNSVTERKTEETGCEVICGAPTTSAVKGQVTVKVKVNCERGDANE